MGRALGRTPPQVNVVKSKILAARLLQAAADSPALLQALEQGAMGRALGRIPPQALAAEPLRSLGEFLKIFGTFLHFVSGFSNPRGSQPLQALALQCYCSCAINEWPGVLCRVGGKISNLLHGRKATDPTPVIQVCLCTLPELRLVVAHV